MAKTVDHAALSVRRFDSRHARPDQLDQRPKMTGQGEESTIEGLCVRFHCSRMLL
jgi:hypothetical protein